MTRRSRELDGEGVGIEASFNELLVLVGRSIRLEILGVLAEGPRDVSDLAATMDLGITLTSNHLCRLADHGLLNVRRERRRHIYDFSPAVTTVRTESGEHFFLATQDGGWVLLRLPDPKARNGVRRPTLEDMQRIAQTIAVREPTKVVEPPA